MTDRRNGIFKKINKISNGSQVKNSVRKGMIKSLSEDYPNIIPVVSTIIFPKKVPIYSRKAGNATLYICNDVIWFFSIKGQKKYYPTLKTVHKFPNILPKVGVDKGAISFVIRGVKIMCVGLTSEGGNLDEELEEDTVVQVMAEGKVYPCGVGILAKSTNDIKEKNEDVGVWNIHYLGDELWKLKID